MSIVVAVTGVSSLLGENLLEILESRAFPVARLVLTDPGEVVGRSVMFAGHANRVVSADKADFNGIDLLFNCQPGALPEAFTPGRIPAGVRVIDLCPEVGVDAPCIVPEVNAGEVSGASYLISPMPAVVVAAMALSALHQRFKLLRLNLISLCSVAEAGRKGIEALASETAKLLNGRDAEAGYFGQQIAFNLLPVTGSVDASGRTDTETRVSRQLQQVLGDEQLEVAVTSLQLPLFHGQNVVLHAECQFPVDLNEAQSLLRQTPGLRCVADQHYTVVSDAAGQDEVFISRLRTEADNDAGIMLFAVSDSLRKGGALNAIQIAEHLLTQLDH
ncbi:Aspartate-semialdehyde dehydrogenase [Nitrincola lacisaponensis]|uniref:Aspartate-semialdehyde dehydrogenase n=1 Tax=Nitrincola lacisaponensis TaxID=267850 RepID=A0A063Y258_9GAMM|nr:Asd/ArgC dimerization domain-containing protein [Nitrincola lacisaponensis]KDE38597.1 Aspartate-semialdehyde dehydrogenase [Nitrincola lacisaponensis]